MAELFELAASLRLDLSSFEQEVARAEALAAQLEARLARLASGAPSALSGVQQAMSVAVQHVTSSEPSGPAAAVQAGQTLRASDVAQAVAQALGGVSVRMDGRAVGQLVAPVVDEQIGLSARERRYTG